MNERKIAEYIAAIDAARAVIGRSYCYKDKSLRDIQLDVLDALGFKTKDELNVKSDEYVDAAFQEHMKLHADALAAGATGRPSGAYRPSSEVQKRAQARMDMFKDEAETPAPTVVKHWK